MTTLAARIFGPADAPEDTLVTAPQRKIPAVPGTSGIPWYAGVPLLDPDCRVADARFGARCAAMACAALVFGADAGHRAVFRSPQSSPAGKWCRWLLSDADDVEVRVRALALRLTCEQVHAAQAGADADVLLRAVQDLYAGCAPW